MNLQQVVAAEMGRYVRHLADRVEQHLRALPKERIYEKPFAYGNSIGHLVLHLTGNLNHFIGAEIAGTGYVRNRELEFTDSNPPSPEEALAKFRAAIEMVVQTIETQSPDDWGKPIEPKQSAQTRFGLVLMCVSHINNHIGQMAWIVQAQGYDTQKPEW